MNSKLNISDKLKLEGLLDFDGSVAVSYYPANTVSPDIRGNRTIKWNMYLDSSISPDTTSILIISDSSTPSSSGEFYDGCWLSIYYGGDWLIISDPCLNTAPINNFRTIPTDDLIGKTLRCEIKKETQKIIHFKVNDVSLVKETGGTASGSASSRITIGGYNDILPSVDGTFWDLEIINDDTSERVHYWKGYPVGNEDSAWVDQIGTLDLSISKKDGCTANLRSVTYTPNNLSNKLELNLPSETLTGVADFADNMYVILGSDLNNPSMQYGKRVEWKMYLDQEDGYDGDADAPIQFTGESATSDMIRFKLDGSLFKVKSNSSSAKFYPIAGFSGQILDCVVEKSRSIIDSFSINGQIQTPIFTGFWGDGGASGMAIAKGNLSDLSNATVWDVKIYDTSTAGSPLIHSWKGYPAGNTDAAWVDDVSTMDGDLLGAGGTRDIMVSSGGGDVLTASRKLFVGKVVVPPLIGFLSFITDSSSATFDPALTVSSGTLNWNLGDASTSVDANAFSHTYSLIGDKTVNVFPGTTAGATAVTGLSLTNDQIKGTLDISNLTNLTGIISLYSNPGLTSIVAPTSSQSITNFSAHSCNLEGVLDLSGLTGLSGVIVDYNNNLTGVTLPATTSGVISFTARDCSLSGDLDLSLWTNQLKTVNVSGNSNLTSIQLPSSTEQCTFSASDCSLFGTLDVSGFTNLTGIFNVSNNKGITNILFPPSSSVSPVVILNATNCDLTGTIDASGLTLRDYIEMSDNPNLTEFLIADLSIFHFRNIYFDGCGLGQESVDHIFSVLNTIYTNDDPTNTLRVYVDGGTNSPPTDGGSNTDILSLENIFSLAGESLIIHLNT